MVVLSNLILNPENVNAIAKPTENQKTKPAILIFFKTGHRLTWTYNSTEERDKDWETLKSLLKEKR